MIHVNNIIYYFSHILHNSHIIACEPALDAEETVLKLKDCDHTNPAVNKLILIIALPDHQRFTIRFTE